MATARTRRELLAPGASAARSDTGWLERLLSIELLLLYAYDHVLDSAVLPPGSRRALAPILAHERAHVSALTVRVRGRSGRVPPPPADDETANRYLARRRVPERVGQLRGPQDALNLLLALERVTVGAYFVALIKLHDRGLITLAAEIMASDAQHEAIVGLELHPADVSDAVAFPLVQGVQ